MSIKETLDKLPNEQRRQLMYAFEHGFEQFIKLPDGKFIGVNVAPIKHLEVTESAGNWAIGNVKGDNAQETAGN